MKEYVLSIISIGTALDALGLICHERYKKITGSALGLLLILVVILPLPKIVQNLGESLKFEVFDIDVSSGEFNKTAFEEGISLFVAEKFSLKQADVEVEVISFSSSEMRAERIIITLTGSAAIADNKKIRQTLEELDLGAVEVKIEI